MKKFIKLSIFIISVSYLILLSSDINFKIAMFFNLFLFLLLSFLKFWISKKNSIEFEVKPIYSDANNKNFFNSDKETDKKSPFSKAKQLLKKYTIYKIPKFKSLIGNPESKKLMKIKNSFI